MADKIDVYLITGFLGSGKTTFLNRLFSQFPRELKLMVLMNEFGEIGVDGTLVSSEDLDILEISKGSIFCACVKTDFIKGLYEIVHKIKPDVLLIESTGVANPADLQKDLSLPIFNDSFRLKEQFCIIDAAHFLDEFGVFASVERQISSSSRFIINKIDLASKEQIEEIKSLVREHHPDPKFYETTYTDVDFADLLLLDRLQEQAGAGSIPGQMTEEELEEYVEDLLNDPNAELTPPDILMSATFLWKGGDLAEIGEFTGQLPRGVVRAKGFLRAGQGFVLYNYVMGRYEMEDYGGSVKKNQENVLVFIAPPRVMPLVEEALQKYNFVKLGELMPGPPPSIK
ncbi:MAG: GTP-binding protein [Firmicutes bacterium]|nr:GTP-binding protein [Bacillota bacterium]